MDDWRVEAELKIKRMPQGAKNIRERAKEDLCYFAKLVNPGYMYGEVHMEIYRWMQDYTLFGRCAYLSANKLIMLPRAHLKSHMVATWCAWIITRHPEITIFYVSATAELAYIQLYAIKNILGSTIYNRYFPEYVNPAEGKRETWSSTKIIIDHEQRAIEGIRDPTIATAGLTTNTTGWHADIVVADDLVVPENAYTEDGRATVTKKTSQFTSIRNAGGFTMACGTRYHPADEYDTWAGQTYEVFNEDYEIIDMKPVWDIKEYAVETDGIFIWPSMVRPNDNKTFGFNPAVLARIKAEYTDKVQFHAQYYNDPNDKGSTRIDGDSFLYYDRKHIQYYNGAWHYKDRRLNIYAAVDFAFSLNKTSDYSAIVVIGIDYEGYIYVLDIDRFKTDRTREYFKHIKRLHSRWTFRKLRAEVTVAQEVIVNDIKGYLKKEGLHLKVEKYRPNRTEGSKEERMKATLEWRYEEGVIYHTEGGYTLVLEEEVQQARPKNDDVKDALTSAIQIAVKPRSPSKGKEFMNDMFNKSKRKSRFGGYQR